MVAMERTEVSTSYDEKQKHFFAMELFLAVRKTLVHEVRRKPTPKSCLLERPRESPVSS